MDNNICNFINQKPEQDTLQILYFVYETNKEVINQRKLPVVYYMGLVEDGQAKIHMSGQSISLKKGSIFFLFPSVSYYLEPLNNNFKYYYISFFGTRVTHILDTKKINEHNFVFHNFDTLVPIWQQGVKSQDNLLSSEGILLYSFSCINIPTTRKKKQDTTQSELASQIKQYVDNNFSNEELNVSFIAKIMGYNEKYVASIFKNIYKIKLLDYISLIRINHACSLFNEGKTSVQDVATLCGFSNPLYFSKVFSIRIGMSPKGYKQLSKTKT